MAQVFIRIQWGNSEPFCSILVLNRERRWMEPWRFVSYSLEHANWRHLISNVVSQLLVGIPLEMTHSSGRVAVVYLTAVTVAGLGWSVYGSGYTLAGCSGGLYALYLAHGASLLLNFRSDSVIFLQRLCHAKEPRLFKTRYVKYCRLVILVASMTQSFVQALLQDQDRVSDLVHILGAVAGLLMGIAVLKDRRKTKWITVARIVILMMVMVTTGWLVYLTIDENLTDTIHNSACSWSDYQPLCILKCQNGVYQDANCTVNACKPIFNEMFNKITWIFTPCQAIF